MCDVVLNWSPVVSDVLVALVSGSYRSHGSVSENVVVSAPVPGTSKAENGSRFGLSKSL